MVGGKAELTATVSVVHISWSWLFQYSTRALRWARSASVSATSARARQLCALAYASATWVICSSSLSGSIMGLFLGTRGGRGRAVVAGPAQASRVSDSESWIQTGGGAWAKREARAGAVVRGTACRVVASP